MKTFVYAIAVFIFTACAKENVQPGKGSDTNKTNTFGFQKNLPAEKTEVPDIIRCGTPVPETKPVEEGGVTPIYIPPPGTTFSNR